MYAELVCLFLYFALFRLSGLVAIQARDRQLRRGECVLDSNKLDASISFTSVLRLIILCYQWSPTRNIKRLGQASCA